jgi:ribonuclease Z
MPSDKFVEAARNVTLIIHEATMGDEEQELASQKKHSTVSQALDIGRRCLY